MTEGMLETTTIYKSYKERAIARIITMKMLGCKGRCKRQKSITQPSSRYGHKGKKEKRLNRRPQKFTCCMS